MRESHPFLPAVRSASRNCAVALLPALAACGLFLNSPTETRVSIGVKLVGNGGGEVQWGGVAVIDGWVEPWGCSENGNGEKSCGGAFNDAGRGGTFSVVAVPDELSTFAGWTGDCVPDGLVCWFSFEHEPGGASFSVAARFTLGPPTATIEAPSDGASFRASEAVRFTGRATDARGRNTSQWVREDMLWSSSLDGTLCVTGTCGDFKRRLSPGKHVVTLTVRDSEGTPGTASVTISVQDDASDSPPSAEILLPADGASFAAGEQIVFSGTGSDPEDGTLPDAALGWSSTLDGALGAGPSLSRTLSSGTHVIRLIATDSGGQSDTASVTITVAANAAPVATITSPSNGQSFNAGAQISFAGNASDPEQGALGGGALAWTSSVDGTIGTGTSFTRTLSIGTHTVTLTATDALGASGAASVDITVTDGNPTASISGRVTGNGNGVAGATLTLTGPVSRTATSNGSGYYSFMQLPAGTYTISVSTELNISFPSNPQTVTLAQGQSLTVDFAGTY